MQAVVCKALLCCTVLMREAVPLPPPSLATAAQRLPSPPLPREYLSSSPSPQAVANLLWCFSALAMLPLAQPAATHMPDTCSLGGADGRGGGGRSAPGPAAPGPRPILLLVPSLVRQAAALSSQLSGQELSNVMYSLARLGPGMGLMEAGAGPGPRLGFGAGRAGEEARQAPVEPGPLGLTRNREAPASAGSSGGSDGSGSNRAVQAASGGLEDALQVGAGVGWRLRWFKVKSRHGSKFDARTLLASCNCLPFPRASSDTPLAWSRYDTACQAGSPTSALCRLAQRLVRRPPSASCGHLIKTGNTWSGSIPRNLLAPGQALLDEVDRRVAATWPLPMAPGSATPPARRQSNLHHPSTASTTASYPTPLDAHSSASASDREPPQPAPTPPSQSPPLLPRHLCILAWSLAVLRPASPTLRALLRTAAHVAAATDKASSECTTAGGQAVHTVPLPYHVYGLSQLFLANYAASLAEAESGVEAEAVGQLVHQQHGGPGPGAEGACCAPPAAATHASGAAPHGSLAGGGSRTVDVGTEGCPGQGALAVARTAAAVLRWRRRRRGSEPVSQGSGWDGGGGCHDSGVALSGSFTGAAAEAEQRAQEQEEHVDEEEEAGFGTLWKHCPTLFAAAADAWVETTRGTIRSALQGAVVGELRGRQGAGGGETEGTGVEKSAVGVSCRGRMGEVEVDVGDGGSGPERVRVRVEVEAVGEEVWLPGWVFGVDVLCRVRLVRLGGGGEGTEGLAAWAEAGSKATRGAGGGQVGSGRGDGGVGSEGEGEVWLVGIQVDGPSHFVAAATEGGTGAATTLESARGEARGGGEALGGRGAGAVPLLSVVGETSLRDWCCALALGPVEGAQQGQQGQGLYAHVRAPPLPRGVLAVRRHPDPWVVACLAEQLQQPLGQEGQWTQGAQPCSGAAGAATHARGASADGGGDGESGGGGARARRVQEGRVAGVALARVSHADWQGVEGQGEGQGQGEGGRWSGCLLPLLARACTCR